MNVEELVNNMNANEKRYDYLKSVIAFHKKFKKPIEEKLFIEMGYVWGRCNALHEWIQHETKK